MSSLGAKPSQAKPGQARPGQNTRSFCFSRKTERRRILSLPRDSVSRTRLNGFFFHIFSFYFLIARYGEKESERLLIALGKIVNCNMASLSIRLGHCECICSCMRIRYLCPCICVRTAEGV